MNALLIACVVLAGEPGPADAIAPLRIQTIQVPNENPIDQIRKYLPKGGQVLSLDQFRQLLARVSKPPMDGAGRPEGEARLFARVDWAAGRLTGRGEFILPAARMDGGRTMLDPWNLEVRSVSPAGDSADGAGWAWGSTREGAFVLSAPSFAVNRGSFAWDLTGTAGEDRLEFDLLLPPLFVRFLEVEIPTGWRLRTSVIHEPGPDEGSRRLYPTEEGSLAFVLERITTTAPIDAGISYDVRSVCQFSAERVRFQAELSVACHRRPPERLRIVADPSLRGASIESSVAGDWTPMSEDLDRMEWAFVPSTGDWKSMRIVCDASIPIDSSQPWQPPALTLIDGTALKDELTFRLAKPLEIQSLDSGGFELTSTRVEADGTYRIQFDGEQGKNRPTIWFGREPTRLAGNAEMRLALSDDPLTLEARFQLSSQRGTVRQVEAILPENWQIISSQADPGRQLDVSRSTPTGDGRTTLWISIEPPLRTNESMSMVLDLRYHQRTRSLTSEFPMVLPEVLITDMKQKESADYTIELDRDVPCRTEELPLPRVDADDSSRPMYHFGYRSPIRDQVLTLLPAEPRYRGELRQRIRNRSTPSAEQPTPSWQFEYEVDLSMKQGSIETLHLVSNEPLPPDLTWSVTGDANSVVSFEPFAEAPGERAIGPALETSPDDPVEAPPELFHYQLRLALPVDDQLRLTATWEVAERNVVVPLLDLPDARDFSATVGLISRTGRVVGIDAQGLTASKPTTTAGAAEEPGRIWWAGYDRLDKSLGLKVSVGELEREAIDALKGRALVDCHTYVDADQLIHEVHLTLDTVLTRPLRLNAPPATTVWTLELDGVSLTPAVSAGDWFVTDQLLPGNHHCRIVYATAARPSWGSIRLEMPALVPDDWEILSAWWSIETRGSAYILADESMRSAYGLVSLQSPPPLPVVDLSDSQEGAVLADRLRQSFLRLIDRRNQSTEDFLVELLDDVPDGTAVVVDRHIRHRPRTDHPLVETLDDWIRRENLVLVIGPRICVVTSQTPRFLQGRLLADWNTQRWIDSLTHHIREQGADPTGWYRPLSDLADGDSDFDQSLLSTLRATHDRSWTYAISEFSHNKSPSALLVPASLITRLSRLFMFVGILTVLLVGRRYSNDVHRRSLAVLLMAAVIISLLGGITHHLLTSPVWVTIAATVALMIARTWMPTSMGSATVLLLLWPMSAVPAQSAEPSTYRILVPVDEQGPVGRVIVPESLLADLRDRSIPQENRLVLQRADYEGQSRAADRSAWRAALTGWMDVGDPSRRTITLGFDGVEMNLVRVDGKPAVFRRAGAGWEVDWAPADQKPTLRVQPVRLDVEFDTPVLGTSDRRSIRWKIPPSSSTEIRLQAEATSVHPAAQPAGWRVEEKGGQTMLTLSTGAIDDVSLEWLEPQRSVLDENQTVESIRHYDIRGDRNSCQAHFRFADAPARGALRFAISSRAVVTGVSGTGVLDWNVVVDKDHKILIVNMSPSRPSPTSIRVALAFPQSVGGVSLPDIKALGVSNDSMVWGITLPEGSTLALTPDAPGESANLTQFVSQWSQLVDGSPPPLLAIVRRDQRPVDEPLSEMPLVPAGPLERWSGRQEMESTLDPNAGQRTSTIQLEIVAARSDAVVFHAQLDPADSVWDVQGPRVRAWYLSEGRLTVLFDRPISEPTTVSIQTRSSLSEDGAAELSPPVWQDADQIPTSWRIRGASGYLLAPAVPTASATTFAESLEFGLPTADRVAIVFQPAPVELWVQTTTRIAILERASHIQGDVIVHVRSGMPKVLEFRTSAGLANIEWDTGSLPEPTSRIEGDERVWEIQTSHSTGFPWRLRWRTNTLRDDRRTLIPRVRLASPAKRESWVAIENHTQRVLSVESVGLIPVAGVEFDRRFDVRQGDLSPPTLGVDATKSEQSNLDFFRTADPNWQLTVSLGGPIQQPPAYRVWNGEADLLLTPGSGPLLGVSRWIVEDADVGQLVIDLAEGTAIERLSVDGSPFPIPEVSQGVLQLPIIRKGRKQRVTLEWQLVGVPNPTEGARTLPAMRSAAPYPLLVRVRRSYQSEAEIDSPAIDLKQWLLVRLANVIELLEDRRTIAGDVVAETDLAGLHEEARRIESQLRGQLGIRLAQGPSEGATPSAAEEALANKLVELEQRRRSLLASGAVEQTVLPASERPLYLWRVLGRMPHDQTEYFLGTSEASSLRFTTRTVVTTRIFTTNEWMRVGLAAGSLVLVLVTPIWMTMRFYWPAAVLSGGGVWALFADTSWIGWILIVVGFVGLGRLIRRWFLDETKEPAATYAGRSTYVAAASADDKTPVHRD